jgi:cell division protein FtsB
MKFGALMDASHTPWRRLFFAVIAACMLGASWSMYELGLMRAGYNRFESIQKHLELNAQIDKLSDENRALREQVTMLERTRVVDSESTDEVRNSLKQLQDEILELRQEADFYRGIISPGEGVAGLDVQSFKLSTGGEAGLYHYDLVMTQVLRNESLVSGAVQVSVQGVKDGAPLTLDFKDISPNNSVADSFKFRYYQKLAGDIRLPAGFVARTVRVEITSGGRRPVNKSFPWVVQK